MPSRAQESSIEGAFLMRDRAAGRIAVFLELGWDRKGKCPGSAVIREAAIEEWETRNYSVELRPVNESLDVEDRP